MNAEEYFSLIENSDPSQWLNNENVYHTSIGQVSGGGAPHPWLEADRPHSLFVFRDDLAISIAMGRNHLSHYQEAWAAGYADRRPSSGWIDFLYNGNLVYSTIYVNVDGARCSLPSFSDADKTVNRRYNSILKVLHHAGGGAGYGYDDYFARSGAQLSDAPWPPYRGSW